MQTFRGSLIRAFTLIELLIVITIIGILAVALVPRISQGPAKARDVTRKADIGSISTALQAYFSDNGAYPAVSMGTYECISSISGSDANAAIAPLMKGGVVPTDPTTNYVKPCSESTKGYAYLPISVTSYVVAALLESTSSTGEGIYCGLDLSLPNFDVTTNLTPCTTAENGTDHFYALYQ